MQETYDTTNDNIVFAILRNALEQDIELVDSSLIGTLEEKEHFALVVPTDMKVLRSIAFFSENRDSYHFVQLGEYLSFKNLEFDKPFMAYTRDSVGTCPMLHKELREIVAYKPE